MSQYSSSAIKGVSSSILSVITSRGFAYLVIIILIEGAVFWGGMRFEAHRSVTSSSSHTATDKAAPAHWVVNGKVAKVADKSLDITDSSGKTQTVAVDDKAKILDSKGKDIKLSDIAKDDKIIAYGDGQSSSTNKTSNRLRDLTKK